MKTVAIVPINALALAKSRLAGILSPEERRRLVFWMAGRVLRAVRLSGAVDTIIVVSPDPDALDWAAARGAMPLHQDGGRLNAGLFQARRVALRAGTEALLVLLADLPLLAPEDIRAFVALAGTPMTSVGAHRVRPPAAPTLALAPDRRRVGTNGMLLRPADAIPFAFGRASFGRHSELAATAGITPHIFASPSFAFDVDEPDDIETLRLRGLWTPDDDDMTQLTMKEGA